MNSLLNSLLNRVSIDIDIHRRDAEIFEESIARDTPDSFEDR